MGHPPPTIESVYEIPVTLSPSRIESFTSCPLAFRFSSLDQIPEPPTVAASMGTLVHRALEMLYAEVSTPRDLDERATDFSMERLAEQYLSIYRKLLSDEKLRILEIKPNRFVAIFGDRILRRPKFLSAKDD